MGIFYNSAASDATDKFHVCGPGGMTSRRDVDLWNWDVTLLGWNTAAKKARWPIEICLKSSIQQKQYLSLEISVNQVGPRLTKM